MNEQMTSLQFSLILELGNEDWAFDIQPVDADQTKYTVDASGPASHKLHFDMTTTATGKWIAGAETLPEALQHNTQAIGRAITLYTQGDEYNYYD